MPEIFSGVHMADARKEGSHTLCLHQIGCPYWQFFVQGYFRAFDPGSRDAYRAKVSAFLGRPPTGGVISLQVGSLDTLSLSSLQNFFNYKIPEFLTSVFFDYEPKGITVP